MTRLDRSAGCSGRGGGGDEVAFRFLEQQIPADATLALAVVRNTYLYPAWDPAFAEPFVFVPDCAVPATAGWLVVGPTRSVDELDLRAGPWILELDYASRLADLRR